MEVSTTKLISGCNIENIEIYTRNQSIGNANIDAEEDSQSKWSSVFYQRNVIVFSTSMALTTSSG